MKTTTTGKGRAMEKWKAQLLIKAKGYNSEKKQYKHIGHGKYKTVSLLRKSFHLTKSKK